MAPFFVLLRDPSVDAIVQIESVALSLQILITALAIQILIGIPRYERGMGIGEGIEHLHLAAGVTACLPLQEAGR